MDSEALSSAQPSPLSSQPMKRHTNLNSTDKSTLITRHTSPNFIPHEPVRGAVSPVVSTNNTGTSSAPYCPPTFQEYLKSKAALNKNPGATITEPKFLTSHRIAQSGPQSTQLQVKRSTSHTATTNKKKIAPTLSHVSHVSNSMLKHVYGHNQAESSGTIGRQINEGNVSSSEKFKLVEFDVNQDNYSIPGPPDGERQIEGQQSRLSLGTEKMQLELKKTKDELEVQLKVGRNIIN